MNELSKSNALDTSADVRSRIFVAGDLHGDFRRLIAAVQEHRPLAVISVGDIEPRRRLEEELAAILPSTSFSWIHGNHDTDCEASYDNLFGSALAEHNFDERVVTVARGTGSWAGWGVWSAVSVRPGMVKFD